MRFESLPTQELLTLLDGSGGFRRMNDAKRGLAARRVLQQILHSFRSLSTVLFNVLVPKDLVAAAALLLHDVAERISGAILRACSGWRRNCHLHRCWRLVPYGA